MKKKKKKKERYPVKNSKKYKKEVKENENEANENKKEENENKKEDNENLLQEIVKKFDEEYNIFTIVEEDEFREKIIELNYDEDKIREWIERKLAE